MTKKELSELLSIVLDDLTYITNKLNENLEKTSLKGDVQNEWKH